MWSSYRLDEVARIVAGGKSGLSGKHFVEEGFPAYGAGGLNGMLATWEYEDDAVVLSSIGARCGKCFLPAGKWTSLANTQLIFPDPEIVDRRFLWYLLNDEARWHRSGSAQPYIKPSDVKSHRVSLPPLPEQRRIASVLDQAATIADLRNRAVELIDALTGSIFDERFAQLDGPAIRLEELLVDKKDAIRTGPFGSQMLVEEFVDEGVQVLGIDNVRDNVFAGGSNRHITPQKYRELERYTVLPGDVLITIMGTVGRVCVVPEGIPLSISSKHLCALTLRRDEILPEYMQAYVLNHPRARLHLNQTQKGAIMAGLNMSIIKDLPVIVPPLSEQERFVADLATVGAIREQAELHEDQIRLLTESLATRAFKGEL